MALTYKRDHSYRICVKHVERVGDSRSSRRYFVKNRYYHNTKLNRTKYLIEVFLRSSPTDSG
ncbi:hypothetical protein VspSTUT16_19900 [Vibrio sp. STUT-A16]|nr:hypothetical protein VspSTUT16_19900 [Vibrio sp. STUT-A16]